MTAAFVILLLATATAGAEELDFRGLERLYFQPFADPAEVETHCASHLRSLLPSSLSSSVSAPSVTDLAEEAICERFALADHPLPLPTEEVVLREVRDHNHPRIHGQYWCLYSGRRRTGCWHFAPLLERTENKMLSPLFFERAVLDDGLLVLQVAGTMARPQGAFWLHRADLVFDARGGSVELLHVIRRFVVYQGYSTAVPKGDDDFEIVTPPPMVAWEQRSEKDGSPVVVVRRVEEVQQRDLDRCEVDDLFDGSRDEVERWVRCLTEDGASVSVRRLDEPSFIERGWSNR